MLSVANSTKIDAILSRVRQVTCLTLLLVNLLVGVSGAHAGEVMVAVASNFLAAENELAKAFEQQSGHRVVTSSGSTGKLYTQIVQGAPYDIFLAADTVRPRKVIELGLASEEGFTIYATGRLALWSPAAASADEVKATLLSKRYKYLALANAKTAPYGAAAEATLRSLGVRHSFGEEEGQMVFGENISQTYQFVKTGHADLGFVALSQLMGGKGEGAFWPVPEALHQPLEQGAVLLKSAENNQAARAFLAFLGSSEAFAIIASYGYGVD